MADFLHALVVAASAAALESPGENWRVEIAMREKFGGRRFFIATKAPKPEPDGKPGPPANATAPGGGNVPT